MGDSQAELGIAEGSILVGKYRVEKVLGQGGMGVVVAATHIHLGERVAIKFLLPSLVQHGTYKARFLREAQSSVRIKGEHVARVSDVGLLENGAPYMVMEFLQGKDLESVLEERKTLPVDEAVDFVLQACEALAEAHALGIVHRDLKPANLFLTKRPDGSALVKVVDFGIAKTIGEAAEGSGGGGLTATSAIMGSPKYMSPEQLRSAKKVDGRTDVWAMSLVLYELLKGTTPFEDAESMSALMIAIATEAVPPLAVPGVPPALEHAIMRGLDKEVETRTASIAEFAAGIAAFTTSKTGILAAERIARIASGDRQSVPENVVSVTAKTALSGTDAGLAATRAPTKKPPVLLGVGGLAAIVAIGGGAFWTLHDRAHPDVASTTAPPPLAVSVAAIAPVASAAPIASAVAADPVVVVPPVAAANVVAAVVAPPAVAAVTPAAARPKAAAPKSPEKGAPSGRETDTRK